jgi:hypothetical protein
LPEKRGKVKQAFVHHFIDGDSDTLIILEDETKIVYSGSAPIGRGHSIVAVGKSATFAHAISTLHPKHFTSTGKLRGKRPKGSFFLFSATDTVLDSNEINDETDGIIYQEK